MTTKTVLHNYKETHNVHDRHMNNSDTKQQRRDTNWLNTKIGLQMTPQKTKKKLEPSETQNDLKEMQKSQKYIKIKRLKKSANKKR